MCIRDRDPGVDKEDRGSRIEDRVARFVWCIGERKREDYITREIRRSIVCACLLYTSDAADERSSVDLGGRRIIKKKKIEKVVSV